MKSLTAVKVFEPVSVTELNNYIRQLFEQDRFLGNVLVRGEISNFRRHHSGHCYFTLKDAGAAIRCVMFRGRFQHIRFEPVDGAQVRVSGAVSVYERDGAYQLYVESMLVDGQGDLSVSFAKLRDKLLAEGLFDETRKITLPLLPKAIGVVTSPTGAAIRDIATVAKRRNPGIPILLVPAQVQGDEAPLQIVRGIELLDRSGRVDVIVVGRGGGSLEELWAFNDERVVRAIASARTPIVSAVGHQTDYTLSDFAADVRAATPSQAAELVTPDRTELIRRAHNALYRLNQSLKNRIVRRRLRLERCLASDLFRRPEELLRQRTQTLDQYGERMRIAVEKMLERRRKRWQLASEKLSILDPIQVLQRGYSVVRRPGGQVVQKADTVRLGEELDVWLKEGRLGVRVTEIEKVRDS